MPEQIPKFALAEQFNTLHKFREKFKNSAFVDVRDDASVELAHLNSCAHIPAQQLDHRVAELPHKKIHIILIADNIMADIASAFLTSRKYCIDAIISTENMQPSLWQNLRHLKLATIGKVNFTLWQANNFLQQQIQQIEEQLGEAKINALDIACGSGRESVYLAKRGWEVTAVDYQQDALQRTQNLANNNSVEVNVIQRDMITGEENFSNDSFDLIIMFRFLHRPLFEKIKSWLKPGGYFLCETFSIEAEKFGKPRRKHLMLKPGEIAEYFKGFDVSDEYHRELSDGRPLVATQVHKPD